MMHRLNHEQRMRLCRRQFVLQGGVNLGAAALAALAAQDGMAEPATGLRHPLAPRPGHFPARAKRVIYLFMAGGPSHLELFDPKPKLKALNGQVIPETYVKNKRFAFLKRTASSWALAVVSRSMDSRAPSSANCSPTWPAWSTTLPSFAACRPMCSITAPPSCWPTRDRHSSPAARAWAPG